MFYPYLEGVSKWEELRYSLRSVDKHLKADYDIWIVGDLPDWICNVRHIKHDKDTRQYMSATFDAISKVGKYILSDETPEIFIRMYDDVYFLGDRNIDDLSVMRFLFDYKEIMNKKHLSGGKLWRDAVMESVIQAKDKGLEGLMTETHCPEVFTKRNMKKVFEIFEPLGFRLLTSTLYFNLFPFEKRIKDRKTERALFYGYEDDFSFGAGNLTQGGWEDGKFFLNHNDKGLTYELKDYIGKRFSEKCRFEK